MWGQNNFPHHPPARRWSPKKFHSWSQNYLLRSHWRRMTDKQGRPYRIWINAFIKGPDGAPLLAGEKVSILAR